MSIAAAKLCFANLFQTATTLRPKAISAQSKYLMALILTGGSASMRQAGIGPIMLAAGDRVRQNGCSDSLLKRCAMRMKIGSASCRERVSKYVEISEVAVSVKKKTKTQ